MFVYDLFCFVIFLISIIVLVDFISMICGLIFSIEMGLCIFNGFLWFVFSGFKIVCYVLK